MSIHGKVKKTVMRGVSAVVNAVTDSVSQTKAGAGSGETSTETMKALCRRIGAEGIVMLKNEGNVLPLSKDRVVSVFGRVQKNWFYVGYGSGGDVNAPYKVNLIDALREDENITVNEELAKVYDEWCESNVPDEGFWGNWPMCYDEMPVSKSLVASAAAKSDTAIIAVGRAAGEDRENTLTKGSYYLTDEEEKMLSLVCKGFKRVVVLLDCGSIMDMSWTKKYDASAILYVWQCGMESGHCVADVLSGAVSPSGCLADTVAEKYEDYPSAKFFGNRKYNEYAEDIFVGYRFFETFRKD